MDNLFSTVSAKPRKEGTKWIWKNKKGEECSVEWGLLAIVIFSKREEHSDSEERSAEL
jgi:hypothetical protein